MAMITLEAKGQQLEPLRSLASRVIVIIVAEKRI
jgi:hypothetical protein